uniref:Homeodomain-like n=1 Tax=Nonomuraea gerenzanensis TaxID=93944 RepID=A0A1M4E5Z0_9ACTN|nr:Homeodomain-like [Nonomuraea gerenzanensis]
MHGELTTLGIKVPPSTVWEILEQAGLDPAPERASITWADFLRSQADALLACDFIETLTLSGNASTSWQSSSTPPGASVFSAPPLTRARPGSSKRSGIW